MVDYGMVCCLVLLFYCISFPLLLFAMHALLCHVVPHAPGVFISDDEGPSCRRLSVESAGGQSADNEDVVLASDTESQPTPDLISWNGLSQKRSDETLVNWFKTDTLEVAATQSNGDILVSQESVCNKDSVESDALSPSKDVSDLFTLCDDDNRSSGVSELGGRFEASVCQQQSQGVAA